MTKSTTSVVPPESAAKVPLSQVSAAVVPMNGISTATANFQTFSEVLFNFRITPAILLQGLLYSAAVGALGGYLPARRASRVKLIQALRET